jgi:hypothetical protein
MKEAEEEEEEEGEERISSRIPEGGVATAGGDSAVDLLEGDVDILRAEKRTLDRGLERT